MKLRLVLCSILFSASFCLFAHAQSYIGTAPVAIVTPAPSGVCTPGSGYPLLVDYLTGSIYTCNGSWSQPQGGVTEIIGPNSTVKGPITLSGAGVVQNGNTFTFTQTINSFGCTGAFGVINCTAGNFGTVAAGTSVTTPQVNGYAYASAYATAGSGTIASPYTSPSGTGGIQEAINSLPVTTGNAASRTVFIASGYYSITAPITVTNPVNLIGAGWDSVLYVSSSFSGAGGIIDVAPTSSSEIKGFRFADFTILPVSGTPNVCGVLLDGTNNGILDGTINHILVHQLGSFAICNAGTGAAQGVPVLTRIEDSVLTGGISCLDCGDSVTISHNQLAGTGMNTFDSINGASGLIFEENNVTISGGNYFGGATQVSSPKILNNEFETEAGFIGSNGSVLDFDGPVVGGLISGNTFAVVNGITANGLRLNNAVGVKVDGNTFERGATTSNDILATSISAHNHIMDNYWSSGIPYSSMFNNSGSTNLFNPTLLIGNSNPLLGLTTTGTTQNLLQINNNNQVLVYGYLGSPQIQSISGPTYWGENPNNGQFAFSSGPYSLPSQPPVLVAGQNTYLAPYHLVFKAMAISATAPTISSGFGTGAAVMQSNGTATFLIGVGSGGTATSGVIGLPTANSGWNCSCQDITTQSSTVFSTKQTGTTTTSCTVANFNTSGVQAAWASTDQLSCTAMAR